MTNNESLSTFYNRFKLRYDTCNTLGVAGFEYESESIVRKFYAKLASPRYAVLYREKVKRKSSQLEH